MIGIHRLEGFYWVARTGGYARAAALLDASDTFVHRHIGPDAKDVAEMLDG